MSYSIYATLTCSARLEEEVTSLSPVSTNALIKI